MTANMNDALINELTTFFLTRHPWVDWTPTVDQGGAVAVTVTYARYIVLGNTVIAMARLVVTGAGVAGNPILIGGQPTVIQCPYSGGGVILGTGYVRDTGTQHYAGLLNANAAAQWVIYNGGTGPINSVGGNPSFALAVGDIIGFQATYERA